MTDDRIRVEPSPVAMQQVPFAAAVVVAYSPSSPEPDIYYTVDGDSWFACTDPANNAFGSPSVHSAIWTGDRFIAVIEQFGLSTHGKLLQSFDGRSWTWHSDTTVFGIGNEIPYLVANGSGLVVGIVNGVSTFAFNGAPNIENSGIPEDFVVPDKVSVMRVVCAGSAGEPYPFGGGYPPTNYGLGEWVECDLLVTPGENLRVRCGGNNGYNGGGAPGTNGRHGGGASDIRQGGDGLADRVIIGGGGGGQGGSFGVTPARGGDAGHPTADPGENGDGGAGGGGGATAGAGGSAGSGGGHAGSLAQGGNGGAGSYGGGGGGGGLEGGGGGGGSSVSKAGSGGGGSSLTTGIEDLPDKLITAGTGFVQFNWSQLALSEDFGATWDYLESPFGVDFIVAVAVSGDTIVVGSWGSHTTTQAAVAVSTDKGQSWVVHQLPTSDFVLYDLIRVGDQWFAAGAPNSGGPVLFRSSDLQTWTRCVTPWDNDYAPGIAAYGPAGNSGAVYSIVNGGEDGKSMIAFGYSPWNANAIIVSPDGGATWSEVGFISDAYLANYGFEIIAVFPESWHDPFSFGTLAYSFNLGAAYAFGHWFVSTSDQLQSPPPPPQLLRVSPDFTQWDEVQLPAIAYTTLGALAATPPRNLP